MIKCIHDECCWPNCDKTCGLVSSDSSAEEGLIYHLQARIAELKAESTEWYNIIDDTRLTLNDAKNALISIDTTRKALNIFSHWKHYERTCKFNHEDCVYDPGYLKKYNNKRWIELGMPTTCDDCDCGECYDDEDK